MHEQRQGKGKTSQGRANGMVIPGILLSAIDLGVHCYCSVWLSRIYFKFLSVRLGFLFWTEKNRNRLQRLTSLFPSKYPELPRKAKHDCLALLARSDRQEFSSVLASVFFTLQPHLQR
jgi:hypothetical protein